MLPPGIEGRCWLECPYPTGCPGKCKLPGPRAGPLPAGAAGADAYNVPSANLEDKMNPYPPVCNRCAGSLRWDNVSGWYCPRCGKDCY